uniref:Multidrug resistance-associated protein lethal(2)03659 n=1 Tax=Timema shepardi TaxID=629360 RepID=A0A7R9FXF9_TIMSH|nr:unnamed protein product [Timema shepardi]
MTECQREKANYLQTDSNQTYPFYDVQEGSGWTFPIFWKGFRKDFGEEDLCGPRVSDLSTKLGDRLEKNWSRELWRAKENHSTPKFLIAILKTFKWEMIAMGLLDSFKDIVPRTLFPGRGGHMFFLYRTSETPPKTAAFHVREGDDQGSNLVTCLDLTNVVGSILFEYRETIDPIVLLVLDMVQHRAQGVFLLLAVENIGLVSFLELVDGTGCRTTLNILARFPHTRIMTYEPVYGAQHSTHCSLCQPPRCKTSTSSFNSGLVSAFAIFLGGSMIGLKVSFTTYSDSCRASQFVEDYSPILINVKQELLLVCSTANNNALQRGPPPTSETHSRIELILQARRPRQGSGGSDGLDSMVVALLGCVKVQKFLLRRLVVVERLCVVAWLQSLIGIDSDTYDFYELGDLNCPSLSKLENLQNVNKCSSHYSTTYTCATENIDENALSLERIGLSTFNKRFKKEKIVVATLSQPVLLGLMLKYFKPGSNVPKEYAYYYAGGIVATTGLSMFLINQFQFNAFHIGMKLRIACCSLVYRKSLRLSRSALGDTAAGKVVNLLSNDVSRFDILLMFLNQLWLAPLIAIIVMYLLVAETGVPGAVGVLVVFLVVPLQSYTGKLTAVFRRKTAQRTDERIRLMDEIISGIRVIKMYAWEKPFADLIRMARKALDEYETTTVDRKAYKRLKSEAMNRLRFRWPARSEIRIIRKTSFLRGIFMSFNMCTTRLAVFATLITLVLQGNRLSADRVFVYVSYFNILCFSMSSMFVRAIAEVAEVYVSINRLQEFLLLDEFIKIEKTTNGSLMQKKQTDRDSVILKDVTAKWNENSSDNTLEKLFLSANKGKLVAIIGQVGSGKSSLLQAILGELPISSGSCLVNGSLSYACQEPWVFAATIRQNIVFGTPFNQKRYDEVVRVCALVRDFELFPQGDLTMVGERGTSLSGGQKARVNLARAVYNDADVYLLDDPLSAVDTHVGKHLFDECINSYLKHKTRILVTHQLQYLKDADKIVIIKQGQIQMQGSYADLMKSEIDYAKLLGVEELDGIEDIVEYQTEVDQENIYLPRILRQFSRMSTRWSHNKGHAFTSAKKIYGNLKLADDSATQDVEISPNALEDDEPFNGFEVNDDPMVDIGERQANQGATGTESDMLDERGPSRPTLMRTEKKGRPTIIYQPAANRANQNLDLNNDSPYGKDTGHSNTASTQQTMEQNNSTQSKVSRRGSIALESEILELDPPSSDHIEKSSKGKIGRSVYIEYMRAGTNICGFLGVVLMFLLSQGAASGADYWMVTQEESLAYYDQLPDNYTELNQSFVDTKVILIPREDLFSTETSAYIYTAIIVFLLVITFSRAIIFYVMCMKSSQGLHNSMFNGITKTRMRFFDVNPSGRVLNRFSKDIGSVDEILPKALLDATQGQYTEQRRREHVSVLLTASNYPFWYTPIDKLILTQWLESGDPTAAKILVTALGVLVVSVIVNYLFIIPVCAIGFICYLIREVYLKISKDLKRLEGITKSPVFTHLNATLQGLSTIRAYKAQDILRNEFDKHQVKPAASNTYYINRRAEDLHSSAYFLFIGTSVTFGFYLDLFSLIFISLVTFSFLLLEETFGGNVGLAITQSLGLVGLLQWGVRQSAEVANNMMSVERVLEYKYLEQEPLLESAPGKLPAGDWPSKGLIQFEHTSMKYVETDPQVLKDLNITIRPSEKVGIVGRTGAGKSSLISALFRLARVEGTIRIDGVDTKDICLQDLRSRISIIPQDPVLFSGTLRENLDPFDHFSDFDLWNALDDVELKDSYDSGDGLRSKVTEGGSNFSVGQRQLICLARAILRNNKILMLDEATANVDPQTDALIQKTIRLKFADCTVLTVAHRLNTIMDSDKVLVMDAGRMVEFDHPYLLLQNRNGHFSKMVQETGKAIVDQLTRIAQESYISNQKLANDS